MHLVLNHNGNNDQRKQSVQLSAALYAGAAEMTEWR
jgi:hypothetical protein